MKQHIFGFVLFSFIVASFALVFTFFYAPSIPSKEAVKPPVPPAAPPVEKPYTCQLNRNKLSYEILSSQVEGIDNLTTKIKVTWNGVGNAPEKIFIKGVLLTGDRKETVNLEPVLFNGPFENRSVATLVVKMDVPKLLDEQLNWYVNFDVSDADGTTTYPSKNLSEARPVLFVHDKKTKITGTSPLK